MLSFLNNFLSKALVNMAMQQNHKYIFLSESKFTILTQVFVYSNNNEMVSFNIIAMQLCYDCVRTRKKRKQLQQGLAIYGIEIRICICLVRECFLLKALSYIQNLNAVMIDNV